LTRDRVELDRHALCSLLALLVVVGPDDFRQELVGAPQTAEPMPGTLPVGRANPSLTDTTTAPRRRAAPVQLAAVGREDLCTGHSLELRAATPECHLLQLSGLNSSHMGSTPSPSSGCAPVPQSGTDTAI
jgi:hypothetical protein